MLFLLGRFLETLLELIEDSKDFIKGSGIPKLLPPLKALFSDLVFLLV